MPLPPDVEDKKKTTSPPDEDEQEQLYVVRLWDGMDGIWIDITDPLPREEAEDVWNQKTNGGEEKTDFQDIDYYKIFPADTKMHFSDGKTAFREDE